MTSTKVDRIDRAFSQGGMTVTGIGGRLIAANVASPDFQVGDHVIIAGIAIGAPHDVEGEVIGARGKGRYLVEAFVPRLNARRSWTVSATTLTKVNS